MGGYSDGALASPWTLRLDAENLDAENYQAAAALHLERAAAAERFSCGTCMIQDQTITVVCLAMKHSQLALHKSKVAMVVPISRSF